MKIEQANPNTIHLKFRQEKDDENYGNCLWGDVIINCDDYTLTAKTDCGNYMHGWTPTPDEESFIHLLSRIESEYLVGKISVKNVFDFEESKRQTYEIIRQSRDCRENAERIIEDIEYSLDNDNCRSEESFYRTCNSILKENGVYYGSEMICIEKDYPAGAKIFAEIYDTAIKPYLKTLEKPARIKLKPCPFCGGTAVINHENADTKDSCYLIECEDCGALTSFVNSTDNGEKAWNCSKADTINSWNRRSGK